MDRQDLGMAFRRMRRGRVDRQLAEQAAERLVLVMGEVLAAEEHDHIFHQRVVHLLELLIAERARQIDPADLGPDMRRQLPDLDRLVRHRVVLPPYTLSLRARRRNLPPILARWTEIASSLRSSQ